MSNGFLNVPGIGFIEIHCKLSNNLGFVGFNSKYRALLATFYSICMSCSVHVF